MKLDYETMMLSYRFSRYHKTYINFDLFFMQWCNIETEHAPQRNLLPGKGRYEQR